MGGEGNKTVTMVAIDTKPNGKRGKYLPNDRLYRPKTREYCFYFCIPAKSLIQPCVSNTCEIVLAFLCSDVQSISFITSKYLHTDPKFSKGTGFLTYSLPPPQC